MGEKRKPRYTEVAAKILDFIDRGIYNPGEKIPSLRELSDTLQVSINTVKEAYWMLEDQRHILAVPQSGYFVAEREKSPLIKEPDPASMSLDQVTLCRIYGAYQQKGDAPDDACGLGLATLSKDMWPVEKLQKATIDAIRLYPKESLDYQIVPGFAPLREQIAIQSMASGGISTPDSLIITSGCQEAMYLALASITSPGDVVAIESPIYFNLLYALRELKLKVLEIPCSAESGIHLETLEFALDHYTVKAVLSIANFNNPMGSVMPDENKKQLVSILSKRQIPLIEDDIYGDLYFGDHRPRSCKSFDCDGTVIYCSSFSKTISPGLRIGWIQAGRYQEKIETMKSLVNLGASSLPQVATTLFLQAGGFSRYLKKTRAILTEKVATLRKAIFHYFPDGTTVSDPAGGLVVWVTMPPQYDAFKLYRKALAKDIVIAPGPLFSQKHRFSNCIRLNAGAWQETSIEKIAMLGNMVTKCLNR